MRLLQDKIKGFFLPTFSELSLFMMAVAFVLVFLSTESLRSGLFELFHAPYKLDSQAILLVLFVAGLVLSLYHVFAEREKTRIEKYAMLFFAVMANAFCGILASRHILGIPPGVNGIFSIPDIIRGIINGTDGSGGISRIFLILPVWNIINCLLLLVSFRAGWITDRNISDEKAHRMEVLLGFIVTGCIFVVCQFLFKLYWAITFSICVIYATSFGDALGSVFHPARMQAAEANLAIEEKPRPAGKSEKCGLCNRHISVAEKPYVINRKLIVCKHCHDKIQSQK